MSEQRFENDTVEGFTPISFAVELTRRLRRHRGIQNQLALAFLCPFITATFRCSGWHLYTELPKAQMVEDIEALLPGNLGKDQIRRG